jgi:hypothetical protein
MPGPLTRRPLGLAVLFVIALAAACGDGVSPLRTGPGYYRLVSVNGQSLPYISPPSAGMPVQITRGDLVLRSNGTFSLGIGGNVAFGFVVSGTYRRSGGDLVLEGPEPVGDFVVPVSGDSITFTSSDFSGQPLTLTYRRTQLGSSTVPGDRYRLRSIDGRTAEPLVEYDTTFGEHRSVGHVLFDSLTFSDGVFFRRHRSESATGYTNGQVTTVSASEWTTWGAYESGPGWVVLLHYSPPPSVLGRDSLSIAGDTLVRRTALITGIQEDRYTHP